MAGAAAASLVQAALLSPSSSSLPSFCSAASSLVHPQTPPVSASLSHSLSALSLSRGQASRLYMRKLPRSWAPASHKARNLTCRAHKVEIVHNDVSTVLEVPEDETILSVALEAGMDLPHDCKLGVCMTCPAKIERGSVDQSEGMLSDDVQEKGYALMCASYPKSDCKIRVIPEDELLSLQLVTSQ